MLKVAQDGRLDILNTRLSPSGSLAVGLKLYSTPSLTIVCAFPEITGALLTGSVPLVSCSIWLALFTAASSSSVASTALVIIGSRSMLLSPGSTDSTSEGKLFTWIVSRMPEMLLSSMLGTRAHAASRDLRACSSISPLILTFAVNWSEPAVGRAIAIASSSREVTTAPCTFRLLLNASISTWADTSFETADILGLARLLPTPSKAPSETSSASAATMSFPSIAAPLTII